MSHPPPAERRSYTPLLTKLGVILAVAAVVWLLRYVPVEEPLRWLTAEIHALGVWGPLAFAALYVVLTVLLLPSTPVVLAAGVVFGPVLGTATILLGCAASATVSFLLGRYTLHDWAAARAGRSPRVEALRRALGARDGWKLVAAVRLSQVGSFGMQSLLFGLSPIRLLPFLLATVVSMLPGTALYAYLGHAGAQTVTDGAGEAGQVEGLLRTWLPLVLGAVALFFVILYARRVIREQIALGEGGQDS